MPKAMQARIEADEGVAAVIYNARIRGYFENERNSATLSAFQPRALNTVYGGQLGLTEELLGKLEQSRENVLVGAALAQVYGFQTGQMINFTSFRPLGAHGTREIMLRIAGVFEGENAQTDTFFMIGQYDYLNALRARNKDTVDVFVVQPKEGVKASELAVRIDKLFANSNTPTRTQSEKQFLEAFMRQFADVSLIVKFVVLISFVTLLMIVVNTMLLAMRERYFETGVLKTFGFSRRIILMLIMSETLFIFIAGGTIGLGLAYLATNLVDASMGLVLSLDVVWETLAMILGLSCIAGILPALNASRIPIAAAFRMR